MMGIGLGPGGRGSRREREVRLHNKIAVKTRKLSKIAGKWMFSSISRMERGRAVLTTPILMSDIGRHVMEP